MVLQTFRSEVPLHQACSLSILLQLSLVPSVFQACFPLICTNLQRPSRLYSECQFSWISNEQTLPRPHHFLQWREINDESLNPSSSLRMQCICHCLWYLSNNSKYWSVSDQPIYHSVIYFLFIYLFLFIYSYYCLQPILLKSCHNLSCVMHYLV